MNRWKWTTVTAAITLAVATAAGAGMFARRLIQPVYPGDPAMRPRTSAIPSTWRTSSAAGPWGSTTAPQRPRSPAI